jgi:protein-histidine pros-kinase
VRLLLKFNLIFLLLAGSGLAVVAHVAYRFLMENAQQQVLQQAKLMMESARATRDYTSEEIKPLLSNVPGHNTEFIPQIVPAYGAMQSFTRIRKNYPEYTYREPALNPTNPRNRAVDFESDIINSFRNHPEQKEIVGMRNTPTGDALYLARPITVKQSCIECHGVASQAPVALINSYGPSNGFGWKVGEVMAAQIVSVPMSLPVDIAKSAYKSLVLGLVVTFFLGLVAIDSALYFVVIRPVARLSSVSDRVSRGDLDIPDVVVTGKDEIADLSASFNRMHVTVVKALRMLND